MENTFFKGTELSKEELESLDNKSRYMSKILRHDPDHAGISLDKNGWVDSNTLIEKLNIPKEKLGLDYIIEINSGNRFEYNTEETKVRAYQGHSVNVDTELKVVVPPDNLYHGTSSSYTENIYKEGLKPMKRLHVHLSKDIEKAFKVGKRKGDSIRILIIDASKAHNDGIEFLLSPNGVYLCEFIPPNYIYE